MTIGKVHNPGDLMHHIEGVLNDYEVGIISKIEATEIIFDSMLVCAGAEKEGKTIKQYCEENDIK